MNIVKEPLNVDFIVENRRLTTEEEKHISEYIMIQKRKEDLKEKVTRSNSKTKQKT